MRKKKLFTVCAFAVTLVTISAILFLSRRVTPVSKENDILIGLTPAYELIELSEWAESMAEGEYLGINNTKAYGRDEYVTDQFYTRKEPIPQVQVIYESPIYDDEGNVYEKPDNVYGEKWAYENLEKGPQDIDKGMASALHFLSTIQFLASERQTGIYENFMPNADFIHLALTYMDYEYIRTELPDGFVIELIGGVQMRFYEDDQNRIPYTELIIQDIVNSKNEPLILEINLQTNLMREGEETKSQVPERKSTLITQ